jgi:hypothetical protein
MGILNRKITAAVIGAAVIGGVVLPGATAMAAVQQPATPLAAAEAAGGSGVDVITNTIEITATIYQIIADAVEQHQNRPGYVKSLMEGTFHRVDEKLNVMIINTGNRYEAQNLQGVKYEAIAHRKGYPDFHIYVFESGTFVNHGDGGWQNWAFVGVFDRPGNGGTVTFHKFN